MREFVCVFERAFMSDCVSEVEKSSYEVRKNETSPTSWVLPAHFLSNYSLNDIFSCSLHFFIQTHSIQQRLKKSDGQIML